MTDKTAVPPFSTAEIISMAREAEMMNTPLHQISALVTLVAERAAAAEREAIILLADEMDVERTEYCMNVYEEGEQYKHNLLEVIRARSKA